MRRRGLTTIELLLVMALAAIVGLVTLFLIQGAVRASQTQADLVALEQNTAVMAQLLQNDLRLAGFRGDRGDNTSELSSTVWTSDSEAATVLSWLTTDANWGRFRIAGNAVATVELAAADQIRVRRVFRANRTGIAQGTLCIEEIKYARNSSSNLTRERLMYLSDAQDFSTNLEASATTLAFTNPPPTPCAAGLADPGSTLAAQPAASGLESFQVFFRSKAGAWTSARPAAAELAAIGIYLRTRSDTNRAASRCGPFPTAEAGLPAGATTASLGIPEVTYTGTNCRYRRLERTLTIYLPNQQVY